MSDQRKKFEAIHGARIETEWIATKQGIDYCAESMQAEIDKRDARVAQLEEALNNIKWHRKPGGSPTKYEYEIEVLATKALSTSSDTWLADKIREAEVKVLEEREAAIRHKNLSNAV